MSLKENDFIFEVAKEKEFDACADIIISTSRDVSWKKDFLKNLFKSPNSLTLIAKKDKKIVGLINGMISQSLMQSPKIYFLSINDIESAEKGLAGILIDEFIKNLKKLFPKVNSFDVNVPSKSTSMIALYSSKGFVVEGFIKEALVGSDIIILKKRLSDDKNSKIPIA